jgi:hypothetical protein
MFRRVPDDLFKRGGIRIARGDDQCFCLVRRQLLERSRNLFGIARRGENRLQLEFGAVRLEPR